jgi:hypothetical protein
MVKEGGRCIFRTHCFFVSPNVAAYSESVVLARGYHVQIYPESSAINNTLVII